MDPRATPRPSESKSICDDGGMREAGICIFFSKNDFDDQQG